MSRQSDRIKLDFTKFAEKEVKELALGLFEATREDAATGGPDNGSPVDSGRFSASVTMQVGAIDTAAKDKDLAHVRGAPRSIPLPGVNKFKSRLSRFKLGKNIYIAVTLPYSRKIEGGYSKKTPLGVFGRSAATFVSAFKRAKAKLQSQAPPG